MWWIMSGTLVILSAGEVLFPLCNGSILCFPNYSLQDPDGPQTRVGSLGLAVKPVVRDPVGLGVTETG